MKRTIVTIGTAAAVILSSTLVTNPDYASAERNMQNLKQEKQQINSELSAVEQKIKSILLDIEKIHKEIVKLEIEIKENKKLIKEVEQKIAEYEEEIGIINDRIEERNEILKNRIASFQEAGGNVKFLEVVLGAKGMMELFSRVEAVTTMTNADQDLIDAQQRDLEEVEVKLAEQEDMKIDLEEIKERLDQNLAEQKAAEEKVAKKEKSLKKEKEKLQSNLQNINSEILALEAQIRAQMAAPIVSASTLSNNNGQNNTGTPKATTNTSSSSIVNLPASVGGGSAISRGKSVIGTPYRPAGKGPGGFDCSGFVSWAYGGSIPSSTAALRGMGSKVSTSSMQPGDLVFFNTVAGRPDSHVGIYIGNNQFIASNSSRGVEIKSLSDHYWRDTFKGHVRRVK